MKVVIPVAGVGTRLRPLTYTQPKPLIPVAGKPILGFIIDRLKKAGFNEFIFVIGYLGDKINDYIKEKHPDIVAYFIQQNDRKGIGHAIWTARDIIEDEEIFIVLGDTIVDADIEEMVNMKHSCLGVKRVEDPTKFGVAEIGADQIITKVVEKPDIPRSNMALVGLYKIKEGKRLLQILEENIKANYTTHNEIQLTDAIGKMISEGTVMKAFKVENWYDCGKRESLLAANAVMLKKFGFASEKVPVFHNTIIVHPVSIAEGCQISNSIIGPNVTIAENALIDFSIVKESIIGSFSKLQDVVLHNSVIGSDATIKGMTQSLNIGDNTEIDFS